MHPLEIPIYQQIWDDQEKCYHQGKKTNSYRLVPCGKCIACRERLQADWIFRLKQEQRASKQCLFVTFTYDPEHVHFTPSGFTTCSKRDIQLYIKRLRKALPPRSLRYLVCSEYGSTTLRAHYHALLFNYSDLDIRDIVEGCWELGFVSIGTVTDSSIAYTTKYIFKNGKCPSDAEKPFALYSTRPALGQPYVEDQAVQRFHDNHPYVVLEDGRKQHVPRYYRNKLGIVAPNLHEDEASAFFASHPGANFGDFYLWRQTRINQFETNKKKRSKNNEKL